MIRKILLWPLKTLWANLVLWSLFPISLLPHPQVRKHDKFAVLKDTEIDGLLHYNAPYTGGFKCIIPKDTVLVACSDSERISIGFGCVPENAKEFEKTFVPETDRNHPKYTGYSFVLRYRDIGKKVNRMSV